LYWWSFVNLVLSGKQVNEPKEHHFFRKAKLNGQNKKQKMGGFDKSVIYNQALALVMNIWNWFLLRFFPMLVPQHISPSAEVHRAVQIDGETFISPSVFLHFFLYFVLTCAG
jgi:hypothetical protein